MSAGFAAFFFISETSVDMEEFYRIGVVDFVISTGAVSGGETTFLHDRSAGQEWRDPRNHQWSAMMIIREVERDPSTALGMTWAVVLDSLIGSRSFIRGLCEDYLL